jgi:WD40 repeat protein
MSSFRSSNAVVIGIDDYRDGIPPLRTAVNDASRLAEILEKEHGYQVHRLVEDVTKARLEAFFTQTLRIGPGDRLLVYFAGHGIALDGDDGPAGYLIPQDARPEDRSTFLPMAELHGWLDALPCRHLLAILDCCFAGAFRWASARNLIPIPDVIYQERYERFIRDPAWQVITSAAYDQRALDVLAGEVLGQRGETERHSPFALALFEALAGAGDVVPAGGGDGVITATELYLYLRDRVEVEVEKQARHRQTPGLWPLRKHDKGEYILLVPGHELNLPPAPALTAGLNPWRGLKSYDEQHCQLFFGRENEIEQLAGLVAEQPFTAVLGASGTGKSSLVKAGLLPRLRGCDPDGERLDAGGDGSWCILPPMQPVASPLRSLHALLAAHLPELGDGLSLARLRSSSTALADLVTAWSQTHAGCKLLLVVDQFEELLTLCQDEAERAQFLALLARAVEASGEHLRLVITLRTDFEPQFVEGSPLAEVWAGGRYVVPPLDHDHLRAVIEGPASERVLHFEPYELVDELIKEVIQTPGALPLLSFTLSELYVKYLTRQDAARERGETLDRSLTEADYRELGGVVGSLRHRATDEYEALPGAAHWQTMRRVMLRMVAVEGGELARRRVPRSELVYPDDGENDRVETVVRRLVAARLVVEGREEDGEAYVEPAHDALVRAWDKLLVWKGEAQEYLTLQRRLAQAASEWDNAEKKDQAGLLWDGDPRLPQLEDVLWPAQNGRASFFGRLKWVGHVLWPRVDRAQNETWLNRRETEYVKRSVKRRSTIFRRIIRIALAVAVVLVGLVIFAFYQQGLAQRKAEESRINELAAESKAAIAEEPQLALLLSAEAVSRSLRSGMSRIPAAELSLLDALSNGGGFPLQDRDGHITPMAISADEKWLVTANSDGTTRLWKLGDGGFLAQSWATDVPSWKLPPVEPVLANVGGEVLAQFSEDGRWLLRNRIRVLQVEDQSGNGGAQHSFESPTGRVGGVQLWDLSGGEPFQQALDLPGDSDRQDALASVSPDGCWLATGRQDGAVWLWNLCGEDTGRNARELQGHAGKVTVVAFSPDSRWLVTGGEDQMARIWELGEEYVLEPIELGSHTGGIQFIVFDPDSRWLLTGGGQRLVWDLEQMHAFAGLQPEPAFSIEGPMGRTQQVAFSLDGRWLAVAQYHDLFPIREETKLWLWNLGDDEPDLTKQTLTGRRVQLDTVLFSPDGHWLLAANSDDTVHAWELESTGALPNPRSLDVPGGGSQALQFSPDGRWLVAVGDRRQEAQLWILGQDLDLGEPFVLRGHEENIRWVAFSQDVRWLMTGSYDGTARLWDLQARNPAAAMPYVLDPGAELWAEDKILFSGDGGWMLSRYTEDKTQYVAAWELKGDDIATQPDIICAPRTEEQEWIQDYVYFEDQQRLIVSDGFNPDVFDLDFDGRTCSRQPSTPEYETEIDFEILSPVGRWLMVPVFDPLNDPDFAAEESLVSDSITTTADASVFSPPSTMALWDPTTPPDSIAGHCKTVEDMEDLVFRGRDAWSIVNTVVSARWSKGEVAQGARKPGWIVVTWGYDENGQVDCALAYLKDVIDLKFSPDEEWAAVVLGQDEHTVEMWKLDESRPRPHHRVTVSATGPIGNIAVGNNGDWFAIAPLGARQIEFWSLSGREPVQQTLSGHRISSSEVAASPDGRWLASSDDDGRVQLWDLSADHPGADPLLLNAGNVSASGDPSGFTQISFSPDGRWLAVRTANTLQLWPLHTEELLSMACRTAGRRLSRAEWERYFPGEAYPEICQSLPDHSSMKTVAGEEQD